MKKVLFGILTVLFLSCFSTGCWEAEIDPMGYSCFVWVNNSNQPITLSVENEQGVLWLQDVTIQPRKSFKTEWMEGGMAYYPPPSDYIWAMKIVFEDGIEAYCGGNQPPTSEEYPHDPTLDRSYIPEVRENNSAVKATWTYVFTNDDYDAAVAQKPVIE